MRLHRLRRTASVATAVALLAATPAVATPSSSNPHHPQPAPISHNAVSDSFSDTFADPSVIQAKDGWWYTFATADPLRAGDPPGIIHIARTKDWSHWEYLGTVFNDTNRPTWAEPAAGLWAPDIRYVNGKYLLYYTVTDTTFDTSTSGDSAIGVATADTPAGPWTPAAAPIVKPRKNTSDYFWTIDPAGFTDIDGQRYLYWGSYYGGVFATKVSADGTTAVGQATQVAIDNRYEGPYVVRHDGWYYLMASTANCCAGPATGYSIYSGRSRSPLGPFVDSEGTPLLASRVGGTPVVHQNGNRFIGVGHHAVATDTTGRDFLVYHGIDRNKPWLTTPFGINRRPMLIDRLDWIDGWPKVRAGAGPSDTDQPAPVVSSALHITPTDPAAGGLLGLRRGPTDLQSGATGSLRGAAISAALPRGDLRVRLDLKTGTAIQLRLGLVPGLTVTVDPQRQTLTARSSGGRPNTVSTPLPLRSGWQTLSVQFTGGRATIGVSESNLNDPYAELSLRVGSPRGPMVLAGQALVDNVSVQLSSKPAKAVKVPEPRKTLWTNDFNSSTAGLSWIRQNPNATVSGGALNWPVEAGDLVGTANTAGLLLADAPAGDWIAETKVTLDLGVDDIRNFQQAGLMVYTDDDNFARFGNVAIWNTRQTEYGRELAGAPDGRLIYGGSIVGTSAATLWMRIAHHRNAAGEELYRAASSRDGTHWTWAGVWTFDAGSTQRIGLYTHGGAAPAAVASFDYLKFSTSSWPTDPGRG
jgi:arabinan endo-1,5-alpha-L-arabinosidase